MKRILALFIVVVLLFSVVGCGSKNAQNNAVDAEQNTDTDYDYYDDNTVEKNDEDSYTGTNDKTNYSDNVTNNYTSSQNEYKPTHSHYYTYSITKEATCAQTGVKKYTCSCGDSYTETISKKTSHDWEYATCTSPDKCKSCGTTRGEAKGHSYYSSGKCSGCGQQNPIITDTLAKCSLQLPTLPKSVSYYGYSNKLYSTVNVTGITYKFECDNDGRIELEIYFSGEKTYDYRGTGQSDSCKIGWKLYGPDNSVIRSDTFYSPSIKMGETFSNKSEDALYSWDNASAGKFRLEIVNVN